MYEGIKGNRIDIWVKLNVYRLDKIISVVWLLVYINKNAYNNNTNRKI